MKKLMAILVLSVIVMGGIMACDNNSASTTTTGATTSTSTVSTTSGTGSTTSTTATTLRVFTLTELAGFNGNGGTTAYMAVNGTVYDVTNVAEWSNGWHKGMHLAGTDATAAFGDSPHSMSFLNQLTIVGTLAN